MRPVPGEIRRTVFASVRGGTYIAEQRFDYLQTFPDILVFGRKSLMRIDFQSCFVSKNCLSQWFVFFSVSKANGVLTKRVTQSVLDHCPLLWLLLARCYLQCISVRGHRLA